ncbi:MAG TPA: calcium-binding protein [Kofleriaceae bacterium]
MKSSLASILFALVPLAGCASDPATPDTSDEDGDYTGIEEASEGLTDLSSECTFTSSSGLLAVSLATGDVAMLAKSSSGAITINGYACAGATGSNVKRVQVTGTTGAQTLILDFFGGTFAQGAATGGGIDVDLAGGTDAFKIRGTKGADTFVFGANGIAFNADNYKDITTAGVESYVVTMADGADTFSGQGNTATGAAFATAVTVYGGEGDDKITGGAGNDTLDGGNGNDTFTAAAADGDDVMTGGAGVDVADYSARTAAQTLSIDGTANDGEGSEADNISADIETVKGGSAADTITGSANADTLYGGGGNDTITGGLGADVLYGDAGDDLFVEGAAISGGDTFNGGAGSDTVSYASRTVMVTALIDGVAHSGESGENDKIMADVENLTGGTVGDMLTGSSSDNVIDGGGGNDTIFGGAGNDTLKGGAGNDALNGDLGDDRFDEGTAASGNDTIKGGAGVDLVDYSGRTNDMTVVLDPASMSGESGESDVIYTDVENAVTGDGDDTITGNQFDNQLEGGAGVDTINGAAGDDVLDGNAGADVIDCGSGDGDILLDTTVASSTGCEL